MTNGKKIATVILLCGLILTGCDDVEVTQSKVAGYANLRSVPGVSCLYYDEKTLIVYYVRERRDDYKGYGFMSPYYAPNGLPYIYDDGELREIHETD